MRELLAAIVGCSLMAGSASQSVGQTARVEVGAHVHGEGKLAVAIEGGKVAMELEAPAKDIVGFEHAPKTAKQKKALADAKTRLAGGIKLFALSKEAQCSQADAKIELVGFAHKAGKGHSHGKHEHGKGGADNEAEHAEFRVTYSFACKAPAALKAISLGYFAAFKGAHKLDVSLIGPKGQTSVEASRSKPSVDLAAVN